MIVHDDWLLTPQRAAIHLPSATAVIADVHLGYDRARRRRGEAVPDFSLRETCAALAAVLAGHPVRALVIAGDLCEDAAGLGLAGELLARLEARGVRLAGVAPGNHDRGLHRLEGLPLCPGGVALGGWRVVHGDGPLPEGRVVHGHHHPCLRWGRRVAAPCYLVGPERIVLPAFSADAAGVNVLGSCCWHGYRCCALAGEAVLDFGEVEHLKTHARSAGKVHPRQRFGPVGPASPSAYQ